MNGRNVNIEKNGKFTHNQASSNWNVFWQKKQCQSCEYGQI
jgi:hypothetical protein